MPTTKKRTIEQHFDRAVKRQATEYNRKIAPKPIIVDRQSQRLKRLREIPRTRKLAEELVPKIQRTNRIRTLRDKVYDIMDEEDELMREEYEEEQLELQRMRDRNALQAEANLENHLRERERTITIDEVRRVVRSQQPGRRVVENLRSGVQLDAVEEQDFGGQGFADARRGFRNMQVPFTMDPQGAEITVIFNGWDAIVRRIDNLPNQPFNIKVRQVIVTEFYARVGERGEERPYGAYVENKLYQTITVDVRKSLEEIKTEYLDMLREYRVNAPGNLPRDIHGLEQHQQWYNNVRNINGYYVGHYVGEVVVDNIDAALAAELPPPEDIADEVDRFDREFINDSNPIYLNFVSTQPSEINCVLTELIKLYPQYELELVKRFRAANAYDKPVSVKLMLKILEEFKIPHHGIVCSGRKIVSKPSSYYRLGHDGVPTLTFLLANHHIYVATGTLKRSVEKLSTQYQKHIKARHVKDFTKRIPKYALNEIFHKSINSKIPVGRYVKLPDNVTAEEALAVTSEGDVLVFDTNLFRLWKDILVYTDTVCGYLKSMSPVMHGPKHVMRFTYQNRVFVVDPYFDRLKPISDRLQIPYSAHTHTQIAELLAVKLNRPAVLSACYRYVAAGRFDTVPKLIGALIGWTDDRYKDLDLNIEKEIENLVAIDGNLFHLNILAGLMPNYQKYFSGWPKYSEVDRITAFTQHGCSPDQLKVGLYSVVIDSCEEFPWLVGFHSLVGYPIIRWLLSRGMITEDSITEEYISSYVVDADYHEAYVKMIKQLIAEGLNRKDCKQVGLSYGGNQNGTSNQVNQSFWTSSAFDVDEMKREEDAIVIDHITTMSGKKMYQLFYENGVDRPYVGCPIYRTMLSYANLIMLNTAWNIPRIFKGAKVVNYKTDQMIISIPDKKKFVEVFPYLKSMKEFKLCDDSEIRKVFSTNGGANGVLHAGEKVDIGNYQANDITLPKTEWIRLGEEIDDSVYSDIYKLLADGKRVAVVGKAGTGKTYTMSKVNALLEETPVLKMAPTNCAASRIGGKTIHSTLGIAIDEKRVFVSSQGKGKMMMVDEYSMVQSALWDQVLLIQRRDKVGLLVCGDHRQMLSIENRVGIKCRHQHRSSVLGHMDYVYELAEYKRFDARLGSSIDWVLSSDWGVENFNIKEVSEAGFKTVKSICMKDGGMYPGMVHLVGTNWLRKKINAEICNRIRQKKGVVDDWFVGQRVIATRDNDSDKKSCSLDGKKIINGQCWRIKKIKDEATPEQIKEIYSSFHKYNFVSYLFQYIIDSKFRTTVKLHEWIKQQIGNSIIEQIASECYNPDNDICMLNILRYWYNHIKYVHDSKLFGKEEINKSDAPDSKRAPVSFVLS
jgi:predicted class III extradiol MEMO1 family dioxygenase